VPAGREGCREGTLLPLTTGAFVTTPGSSRGGAGAASRFELLLRGQNTPSARGGGSGEDAATQCCGTPEREGAWQVWGAWRWHGDWSQELEVASPLESNPSLPWEVTGEKLQAFEEKFKKKNAL